MDIEGRKNKVHSRSGSKTGADSLATTQRPKTKYVSKKGETDNLAQISEEDSNADERRAPKRASLKKSTTNTASKRSTKHKSFLQTRTSEETFITESSTLKIKIRQFRNAKWYKLCYYFCYYWLALNDHFRLLVVDKDGDTPFLVFTIIFVILF